MTTPDPAVLAALAAECRKQDQPWGVIFLGLAQLQNGGGKATEQPLSRPSPLNTTDRAQRAALNLMNFATCAMDTKSP